jgi:hypothetical protein
MQEQPERSGSTEAVVLIKAAPLVSRKRVETVCCAAIDLYGNWLRLYPVSFRHMDRDQKFGRWDRIRFEWRKPNDDKRIESRRVTQETIAICGKLPERERQRFLDRSIVTSLKREREQQRSLALLRAEIHGFEVERKSEDELAEEQARFDALQAQTDIFTKKTAPYNVCPYNFRYRYTTDDGDRFGTCQDWEVEATFFKWSRAYGEKAAIAQMRQVFGVDYPRKGMLLAMGTHSRYPDQWLINGIIRLDRTDQPSLI